MDTAQNGRRSDIETVDGKLSDEEVTKTDLKICFRGYWQGTEWKHCEKEHCTGKPDTQ